MRIVPTLLVPALLGAPLATQAPTTPTPEALARALQVKYDTVRDFSADFVHTYEGGLLRTKATERGTVLIKKPGKMRWTYVAPEEKLFISDGRTVYSYYPADQQVIVGSLPAADQATTPVLFLVGKGNLTRDFTVAYGEVADPPPQTYTLKLTPKQSERDYEWLTFVIDSTTLQIRRLIAHDLQGGTSTFFFANLKENTGLSDTAFTFTIPSGADVITSRRTIG